ncbi:hypothetical protein GWI33_003014 [Rhynchophorus ferrugineus]|uniref:Uncharacterized protein n=1 Tax=Rhynchophorus ferrugineus TaxID=354439 RepID=A0A834ILU7_RHYFE|nr:hypothetical protein GWI33_003014 [Rhynchophorus ferrugineus]
MFCSSRYQLSKASAERTRDTTASTKIQRLSSGDKSFTGQSPHFSYSPTRHILQETDKERPDSYDLLKQNQAGEILQLRQDPRWKQDQPDDIGFELQRTIKVGNRAQSARQQLWNLRPDSGDPGRYNARYIPEVQQLIAETNIHQTKRAIEQAQTNVKQLQLQRQFINRQQEIIQTLHETGSEFVGPRVETTKNCTATATGANRTGIRNDTKNSFSTVDLMHFAISKAQNMARQFQLQRQFVSQHRQKFQTQQAAANQVGVGPQQQQQLEKAKQQLQQQEQNLAHKQLAQLRVVQQLEHVLIKYSIGQGPIRGGW